MDKEILEKIGLTEGESRVYLALLKTGRTTIGSIIKESGVSNSKVYDILDRLSKKGLVGSVIRNNRKNFEPKDPSRLKEFLQIKQKELNEKKRETEKLIPELQSYYKNSEKMQEAEILQGVHGIKTFTELILTKLSKGDIFYILGAPKEIPETFWAYFQDWHQRRAKKGVKCKILYNKDAKNWSERRKKTSLTEIKFLPKDVKTPALVDIGKDYVATILFTDNPTCFLIQNKEVTESYKQYFNLLWKSSSRD